MSSGFYDKFPTPGLLREAQEEYRTIGLDPPLDATGKPLPYPAMTSKSDIMDIDAINAIDSHALEVSQLKENMYIKRKVEHLRTNKQVVKSAGQASILKATIMQFGWAPYMH